MPRNRVLANLTPVKLYEEALNYEEGAKISSAGALAAYSGEKTGRSPGDKRVVRNPESEGNVWWGAGSPNKPLSSEAYACNRSIALQYLAQAPRIYVQDGFVNWGSEARMKVRIVCSRPYHALFMRNMMIRPSAEELAGFGEPDFTIYNAGECPADPRVPGVTSRTSVTINIERREMVILGTEYAGEMKKGIFSVMHYLMPLRGILTLHSGCNMGVKGDVSLFFGLSGTGKTTLSADPRRPLIGDDEHCWGEAGVFNIEGGCYAKCINLSREKEPDIFNAIKFGAVLENVVMNELHQVDYDDDSITENTRASYPIEAIPNARLPCVGPQPRNVIMLCCDAFGVLPPVARLSSAQAMYHFISGYTAKVAGTEVGVTEPTATFSACFGGAFLMWHPMKYAAMLAEKMAEHGTDAWLVNTGWSGGAYGVGARMKLAHTRAIIDAIHSGELADAEYDTTPVFGLRVPRAVAGVPPALLNPRSTWTDAAAYDAKLRHLAELFRENMEAYADGGGFVTPSLAADIVAAGPQLPGARDVPQRPAALDGVPLAASSRCSSTNLSMLLPSPVHDGLAGVKHVRV